MKQYVHKNEQYTQLMIKQVRFRQLMGSLNFGQPKLWAAE